MTETELITEIRSWRGNRWRHGQALKGHGTDCIQWLVTIGRQAGWIPEAYKPPRYNRDWALHNNESVLLQEIQRFCNPISHATQPGDILIFKYGLTESHAGIYIGNNRMVHAHIRHGVIEEDINRYADKLQSVWRPVNV